jgi:hypothetical protein
MTIDPVSAELRRLANLSPDAIAADLGRRRCKGIVCGGDDCPLAVRLSRVAGSPVSIGPGVAYVHGRLRPLPKPAERFRCAFDHGRYPNLISGGRP